MRATSLLQTTLLTIKVIRLAPKLFNSAQFQIRILHDEMGLTTTTYESQLSLMSEHVATMNDKLATQTDQVNHSLPRC